MALQTNVTGQPGSMWIRVSLGRREIHAKTQIKGKGASGKVNGLLDWHGLLCSRSVPLGTGRRGHFRETTFPFCLRKQLAFGSPHVHMIDGDSRILDDGRPRKAAPPCVSESFFRILMYWRSAEACCLGGQFMYGATANDDRNSKVFPYDEGVRLHPPG